MGKGTEQGGDGMGMGTGGAGVKAAAPQFLPSCPPALVPVLQASPPPPPPPHHLLRMYSLTSPLKSSGKCIESVGENTRASAPHRETRPQAKVEQVLWQELCNLRFCPPMASGPRCPRTGAMTAKWGHCLRRRDNRVQVRGAERQNADRSRGWNRSRAANEAGVLGGSRGQGERHHQAQRAGPEQEP